VSGDCGDSGVPGDSGDFGVFGVSAEPVGPPSALVVPRYAGPDTFARLPRLTDVGSAAVVIAGIPFDSGVSYRPGARFGPASVRAGSKLLRPYHPGLDVGPWAGQQVADAGDLAANPFDLRQAISEVEAGARGLLAAADHLIAIGGDHTIALPLLRATAGRHGPVALVHFDAHLDTWDTYFGAPYTHGTPFRRAVEEGVLALDCSAHVGIRGSLYAGADLTDDRKLGFATVSTTDVARRGVDAAVDRVRERVGQRPVYVSIDIDVLDPAHAPGTGTPEPGGLTTRELQLILRGLDGLRLVGADIVEVAPAYDHAELTSLAAANVAYELLGLFALQAGRSAGRPPGAAPGVPVSPPPGLSPRDGDPAPGPLPGPPPAAGDPR
jgi:agmatinase